MTLPLAKLEADAREATHQRYRMCAPCSTNTKGCNLVWADDNHDAPIAGGDEVCATNADARHIANMSPATTLALIARLRRAEEALSLVQRHYRDHRQPSTATDDVVFLVNTTLAAAEEG